MIYYKYFFSFITPLVVLFSLKASGVYTFSAFICLFGILPALELLTKGSDINLSDEQDKLLFKSPFHDFILLMISALHFISLYIFLNRVCSESLTSIELTGMILAQGLSCGIIGINVAHELGHRSNKFYQNLAKLLLMTSMYGHFRVEHNKGHHRHVATPEDAATARYNEVVYFFWFRSIIGTLKSAIDIEAKRMKKLKKSFFNLDNEIIQISLLQISLLAAILLLFDLKTFLAFIGVAIWGILLLESVNYIEHYGLMRKKLESGRYEKTTAAHSWNSNHPLGRVLLFELSRHSDHHYFTNRPYQILRHYDDSPQMPTGYPGMIILSLVPFLWFKVMNPKIQKS